MKVKHKILWLSYLAFIRQYYTLEKINEQYLLQWDIYLHNRQSTISWVTYIFIKGFTKTVWLEFVSNKQNFEGPYIDRYKNSL